MKNFKKINDVSSFNISDTNIKELLTYFKDEKNSKKKNFWKKIRSYPQSWKQLIYRYICFNNYFCHIIYCSKIFDSFANIYWSWKWNDNFH